MKYKKDFEIYYNQLDKNKTITPVALVNILEETAISHSHFIDLGFEKLLSQDIGWILNRWDIRISKLPRWHDKINIETWGSDFEKFYGKREFIVRNIETGEEYLRAASLWILINLKRRRPIRIPENFVKAYDINPNIVIENPFSAIEMQEKSDFEKSFVVQKFDIDTNNHVNNSVYIKWAIETMPDEIYVNYYLSSIEVDYKKEALFGSEVKVSLFRIKDENKVKEFVSTIYNSDKSKIYAIIKLKYNIL